MNRVAFSLLIFLAAGAWATPTHAKAFKTSYLTTTIPEDWACIQSEEVWVCAPQNVTAAREVLVTFAAKLIGPEDNLSSYHKLLTRPKAHRSASGGATLSQVVKVTAQNILGHPWVQALHLGSEIPDFYTQYLMTVKGQIAVQVTLSTQRSRLAHHQPVLQKIVQNIQIQVPAEVLQSSKQDSTAAGRGLLKPSARRKANANTWLLPTMLGLALVLFIAAAITIFSPGRKKISHRKSKKTQSN